MSILDPSTFFQDWLAAKRPELEQSTYEAYTIYLERHIIPYFKNLGKTVDELIPLDIRSYVTYKLSCGRCDHKAGGLSKVSVRKHLNILKQAFREAQEYGLLNSNPADPVRLKRVLSVSNVAKFISLERVKQILYAAEGTSFYPLLYITLIYGLRRSEVIGLQWKAVDFVEKTLTISHTVVKNVTIVEKDRTKTQSSRRVFPLLEDVEGLLINFKMSDAKPSDYIFSSDNGTSPLRPDSVTKSFQRFLKRYNIEHLRFHDLRHATASILFELGWSIVDVQHWLGHTDIETTKNIYVAYNATRQLKLGGSLKGIFL